MTNLYGKTFFNQKRQKFASYAAEALPSNKATIQRNGYNTSFSTIVSSDTRPMPNYHGSSAEGSSSSNETSIQRNGYNTKFPMIIDTRQKPKYHGNNVREIFPRNNQVERLRRKRTTKDIITELIINYKQEYMVLPTVERYMKCLSFFKTLLENADGDFHNLPRTIIYTSSYLQAQRLALHLKENCGIPCGVGSSNTTKAELLPIFQQCFVKETPILIFESREFKERVDNVDLVVNFSLPSTIEEYARRLDSLVHEKCLTFVTCDEDRQFLRKISDIVEANGYDPPRSLTEVFTFYGGNFERYIKEFQVKDSWIDLFDED
jgi:hypothetical protein